jgi:hypothetical protein
VLKEASSSVQVLLSWPVVMPEDLAFAPQTMYEIELNNSLKSRSARREDAKRARVCIDADSEEGGRGFDRQRIPQEDVSEDVGSNIVGVYRNWKFGV